MLTLGAILAVGLQETKKEEEEERKEGKRFMVSVVVHRHYM